MSAQPCREHLAWAAGLFEGEGCFAVHTGRDRSLCIRLKMTDEDVVQSFYAIVGVGSVTGPYHEGKKKPIWIWQAGAFEDAQAVIAMLWAWLHIRRQQRIKAILAVFHSRQGRQHASSRRKKAT